MVAKGKKTCSLYTMQAKICKGVVNTLENDLSTDLWHRRLGHMSENGLQVLSKKELLARMKGTVTPPTRHPKWVSSRGATLRDCDSYCLTFSFSELTPAFICIISVITKIFLFTYSHYTYHHSGIHYILYSYTRVLYLYYYNFTITQLYI